jgi:glucokinase
MPREFTGLVGDIGATNARFALVATDGALLHFASLSCAEHASMANAIEAFLSMTGAAIPANAVLAVATTPDGDRGRFTNLPGSFSVSALAHQLGLQRLQVINDFPANALAVPQLTASGLYQVGSGTPVPGAPAVIVGPGSGLGVSAVVPSVDGPLAIVGEGGHVTMAAADDDESAVLAVLRLQFGHVSAERLLSGPGLINLYGALCAIDGAIPQPLTPAGIVAAASGAGDARATRAIDMFCAMLGTIAADLALTFSARGGVYIAGGIVPKLGEAFARSPFRQRFEDKGRFRAHLATVPTYVIGRPDAALLGAARLLPDAG